MEIFVFQIIVLLFSVVIHEVSHGYVAEHLGDPTARLAGRLTLNPLKHLDPFGSVILPVILAVTHSPFIFGWAKPVPYNPNNLRDPVGGGAKIAAAGPISNFIIAIIFAIAFRIAASASSPELLLQRFADIVSINILLAVFNLVPIPPLDGSKLLPAILPRTETNARILNFLEQNGFILILIFLFFGFDLIRPVIEALFNFFLFFPSEAISNKSPP